MLKKIEKAIISVHDKSNIEIILKVLKKYEIQILSSGGTYKEIIKLGYKATEISKYTKFNELLDGRVKTLHPKIHSGILNDRSNKKHSKQMKKIKYSNIDFVIVNFYPFQKVLTNKKNVKEIIENIDIGGPTMVRAAAKNFKHVSVITEKKDYKLLAQELRKYNGKTSLSFRENMASKAFNLTANYDSIVSRWFNNKLKINFPEKITFTGNKLSDLRYGENPHQKSSIYTNNIYNKNEGLEQIHGKKLSYNNYNDIFTGLEIISSFKKRGTVIIKHANPSGASIDDSAIKSFNNAFNCDPVSSFGGIVVCNFKINKKIAERMSKIFFEVIMAKKFDKESIKILKSKKNLILIDYSKYKNNINYQTKFFDNYFLVQDRNKMIFDRNKIKCVTKLKPTKKEIRLSEFAMNICKFVKSNSIVISKDFSTIGIGAGQPSRVDSCKIAVNKAKQFQAAKLKNSIAASDAFFPFTDGMKKLIRSGVKLIIQPGGSIRDDDAIRLANKSKIKMIFTGSRHFNH